MKRLPHWYLPLALSLAGFAFGPLLAHLRVISPLTGFIAFAASAVPGALALIVGIYLLAGKDKKRGLSSLIFGLVPLLVIGIEIVKARNYPRINDVTTNLDNPPVFAQALKAPENLGKDLSYPEAYKSDVQAKYEGLISLQLDLPARESFLLAQNVATTMPNWRVTRTDAAGMTLEGEDTSGVFQFTDDWVIRILPLDGSAQVDMRSRSRVGKGDFGANAQRIRKFFAAVEASRKG